VPLGVADSAGVGETIMFMAALTAMVRQR
jgi:hypothetical protein